MAQAKLGHVLVTGGCGFLGNNIVTLLSKRDACTQISSLDIKPPTEPVADVHYDTGDITDYDSMLKLFGRLKPDAVIHTASPHAFVENKDLFYKVNVNGTKNLIRVAQESGAKGFVFTSSASVIHDQRFDLINADETYPLIIGKEQPSYYVETKALAEMEVLAANRAPSHPQFLTAAIRPSGIFGVGDVQLLPPGLSAYYSGQTKVQIGTNENLFDFTEVENVAHAHHLALAALLATADREAKGQALPLDNEKVDGEAFFVTNDAPLYFFDFARSCWAAAGDKTDPSQVWVLSKDLGLFIAMIMGWIYWLFRLGKPTLGIDAVKYMCMTRYYNIDKAKRRLGYKPVVSLDTGVRRGVQDALYRGVVKGQPMELKGKKYD
ncbi:NAD(P)-binding protein [Teratosphaeria nubilosa]|uniref:NAD(P)-binding protein n=1 Tax=Teratosphaeria nubilosa TaxID=161662 RepID=A0A6G1LL74_9PEZI|nr:NAD(P)-binding protein [Teratosphaeria nubilosa]